MMEIYKVVEEDDGRFSVVTDFSTGFHISMDNKGNAELFADALSRAFVLGMDYSRMMLKNITEGLVKEVWPPASESTAIPPTPDNENAQNDDKAQKVVEIDAPKGKTNKRKPRKKAK